MGKAVTANKAKPVYTAERRRNLSEAIKAKWQDPEYRGKILAALRNPAYQDKRVAAHRVRGCLGISCGRACQRVRASHVHMPTAARYADPTSTRDDRTFEREYQYAAS